MCLVRGCLNSVLKFDDSYSVQMIEITQTTLADARPEEDRTSFPNINKRMSDAIQKQINENFYINDMIVYNIKG